MDTRGLRGTQRDKFGASFGHHYLMMQSGVGEKGIQYGTFRGLRRIDVVVGLVAHAPMNSRRSKDSTAILTDPTRAVDSGRQPLTVLINYIII